MRGIRLVSVDVDGTLMTGRGVLAPRGVERLRCISEQGVRVVLNTARNVFATRQYCEEIGLHDPMICTNGAQIWATPEGPAWMEHTIPREIGMSIARLADERDWELNIVVGETVYWRQRPGQALGPFPPNRMIVRTNAEAITGEPVRILAFQPEAIEYLNDLCLARYSQECNPEIYYNPDESLHSLGIFPREGDKGTALRLVLEKLGIRPHEVMAVGDNMSDLAMFAVARISVAMGNAPAQVKERATAVAPSNNDEGVAWAIEKYLLS